MRLPSAPSRAATAAAALAVASTLLAGRGGAQQALPTRPVALSTVPVVARAAADSAEAPRAIPVPARPAHQPLAGPDRPGFSFSPVPVPAGGVQLESGYTQAQAAGQTYRTAGEALLRVGVGHGAEVRVSGQSFASRTDDAAPVGARTTRGTEDARVGVKQRLFAGSAPAGVAATSVAVIAGTTVPSGSPGFGAGAWQPEAVLVVNTQLTPRFSVVENVGDSYAAAAATPDGRRAHRLGTSVAGWYALTGHVSAYAEYAGSRLATGGAVAAHFADAGVTVVPAGHVQFDLRVGAGMNGIPGERFVGAGVTRRW
jgi:hypothetical protein